MRLRKAPYSEFRRVSTSLDNFTFIGSSPVFMLNNATPMDLELKENDLISFMNTICPQCRSKNVVRPPNYGYGKHFPDDIKDKGMKSRVKTSLRKTADLFRVIGNIIISLETVRRLVPQPERGMMESSGYFVCDEQYVHIDGTEKCRAMLKDSRNGNFVESILDDLHETTLTDFFTRSIGMFNVTGDIFITTDGYHYESSLIETGRILGKRIRRQRCLFHI